MPRPVPVALLLCAALTGACQTSHPAAAPAQVVTGSPTPRATPTPMPSPTPPARPKATAPSTPAAISTPAATRPPFTWSSAHVTAAQLPHSWHAGCPLGPAQLRRLTLRYVGWDGAVRTGSIVVNATAVNVVVGAFRDLYTAGFPIRSLQPVDAYGGSDDASMAADNTSGFNCRDVPGTSSWSEHAYGLAVDVNPLENPYLPGDGTVQPPQGRHYLDRSARSKGMAFAGGVLVEAFLSEGWHWGGSWSNPDYQHFSWNGQ